MSEKHYQEFQSWARKNLSAGMSELVWFTTSDGVTYIGLAIEEAVFQFTKQIVRGAS